MLFKESGEPGVPPADHLIPQAFHADPAGQAVPKPSSYKPSKKPWGRRVFAAAAGVIGLVFGYGYWMLLASLAERDAVYALPGFRASVEVEFDRQGIPRIHAASREDAFRALGFVTARDRLYQMDLLRRRGAGRLAEVLGPAWIPSDRLHRILGFEGVAAAIAARLPSDQKRVLKAYVDGINQGIDEMEVLPFEFLLSQYRPEP